jgi:hypothetical protein
MNTNATEAIEPIKGRILILNGKNSPEICAPVNAGEWKMEPSQNKVPNPINRSFAIYPRKILPTDSTAREVAIPGVNSCALTR